ncbi:AMP-dependent synthetase/ligase [Streptomyces sp. NPDC058657]|uniref:AMP-dependent synthetase/ligase n=1 Tax=unclassified Streptomyces TaxID=2593676 RepID=UPI003667FB3D
MTDTVRTARPAGLAMFIEWAGQRHGALPALRAKGAEPVSYAELRDVVRDMGRGLMAAGVAPGDRVAILGETAPAWTYAHFAVLSVGAVAVPVYPTAGEEEMAWVLGDSGAGVVLCENAEQAARVCGNAGQAGPLGESGGRVGPPYGSAGQAGPPRESGGQRGHESDGQPGLSPETAGQAGRGLAPRAFLLGELGRLPRDGVTVADFLERAASVGCDDLAEIVYTSGTTGPPKGCRLTHGNFSAVLDGGEELIEGGPGDRTYLYLPLAHVLAQLIQFNTFVFGGELCYFGGRIEDVIGELAEIRPTHLPSVPRLFEKVHAVVQSLAESQEGGAERFQEAVRIGVLAAEGRLPQESREAYEAADKALYSLVRGAFGGRLRWALTGAAPIAPQTLDFLRACSVPVYEGYGMTESGGAISLNRPGAVRYGTVGRPYPGCEVRISEEGEVLARGPMVFPGYYGNGSAAKEGTREALDAEGWLHTGDLGRLDEDGYLSITGRKKDLIITSAGKNLTPALTEQAIQQSRYVSHAVMVGDHRPHPVALVTLDAQEIAAWAEREGHDLGKRPGQHPAVRELVAEAVEAANARASRPARIRAFAVLDEDFTIGSGALTPTLKVRRRAVLERYAAEIEELYAAGPRSGSHEPPSR